MAYSIRLRGVDGEVAVLAGHRALAGDLPGQPLVHLDASTQAFAAEAPGLVGQVAQDRAGLEHRDRLAQVVGLAVDDRRHLVVRRERQELRPELVALADVHRLDGVGQAGFLQEQGDLVAVGGGPVVQLDHALASASERRV
jgi:hypothetical protein